MKIHQKCVSLDLRLKFNPKINKLLNLFHDLKFFEPSFKQDQIA